MNTLKVFIASSEELHNERLEITGMLFPLNRVLESYNWRIELEKWEWLDASMNAERKQTEYNNIIKQCDICLVLYWNLFGEYTKEELDTAFEGLKSGGNPKRLLVFFKEPAPCITQELLAFKKNLLTQYGITPMTFNNVDSFRLQFLLQIETVFSDIIENMHLYKINEDVVWVGKSKFLSLKKFA